MIATDARAEELYGLVRSCTLCALASTRTLAVPGEGPLNAEVMCIGEAPGVNEDKQGRPFVGAAGQFLSELLGAAGLRRDDVYICNVLKCRPPGNRDPLPNEIDACAEYLDLQIDMVDPLVIVTLGRFSMSKWFPQQAISRIHGAVKEADGRFIVPMYHPAAALHQGNLRQVLLNDFARLPAILERARRDRERPHPPNPSDAATPSGGGERIPIAETASRALLVPEGTQWAEPAFAGDEVEFDPGDYSPERGAVSRHSPSPPALRGPGTDFATPGEATPRGSAGHPALPGSGTDLGDGQTGAGPPESDESVGGMAPGGDEPGNYAGTAAGPTISEMSHSTEEPTAEQETATAAKSQQQLSLFE